VNSHIRGFVKETIYKAPFDVAEMYEYIKCSSPETLASKKHEIIKGWPNTYTFTKFLTEHLLVQKKGDVPLLICRPSIIAASVREPVPGWTDSISAASAVFMAVGMGICPVLPGSIWNVADVIPVDICANMIILGAAASVRCNGNLSGNCHCMEKKCIAAQSCSVPVIHCGTSSSRNPMTWFSAIDTLGSYFSNHPPPNQILKSRVNLVPSQTWFEIQYQLQMKLPQNILSFLDRLAGGGSPLNKLNRAFKAGDRIVQVFSHFTENEWIFCSEFLQRFGIHDELNLEMHVDWNQYIHMVCYGMRKFCLRNAEAQFPSKISISGDVLQRPKSWKSDMKHPNPWHLGRDLHWISSGVEMKYQVPSHSELVHAVLSDPEIQYAKAAETILNSLGARFSENSTRFFGYFLHKLFSSMFDRISVNEEALSIFKQRKCPVLLVPTHRSYLDFLILSYVLFSYSLKIPFIAAGEDFQRIPGVNALLQKSGAFYMRRKIMTNDSLYAVVFRKYFQQVILKHGVVEFFIEGTRSRSGYTLKPKTGLLSFATELVSQGKVPDIEIVPVSISYERVLEAESFPCELLGEPKLRETLARMLKAASVLRTHYGRASVVFGTPISIKSSLEREEVNLGLHITNELNKNLVVKITHLVATALLFCPKGQSLAKLVRCVDCLRDALGRRNCLLDVPHIGTCAELVRKCLNTHFKDLVFSQKDADENVELKPGNHPHLMLAYYRNHLVGMIGIEAGLSACIIALSKGGKLPVGESDLIKESNFLFPLLGLPLEASTDRITKNLEIMVNNGSLARDDPSNFCIPQDGAFISAVFASVVYPFIDCAWLVAVGVRWKRPVDCGQSIHSLSTGILALAHSSLRDGTADLPTIASLETIKSTLDSFVHAKIIDRSTKVVSPNVDQIIKRLASIRSSCCRRTNVSENIETLDFSNRLASTARL
jgi:1-acyl-sn-glycerol-3-phosphate acyltransferase